MKTISVILSVCILFVTSHAIATDAKYYEQMSKQINAVYTAKTIEAYQSAVNALDRIAAAEKTKWEPYYYSAFGNIMMANEEKEGSKKDGYLDMAMTSIEKALAIAPAESELIALEGFVHMIRLTVDPASRGQQYSMLSMQSFGKAMGLNPENPRALLLMAQMQFGTANFFNQEPTEACDTARKAVKLFSISKSDNPIAPVWGKEMAEGLLKMCK